MQLVDLADTAGMRLLQVSAGMQVSVVRQL
jgi:hypothetical protein